MDKESLLTFETRDEFNRKEIADTIIKIIESNIELRTILLDGEWGTGKTEFCQKIVTELENKKFLPIYIDCYKHDHLDDPLLMLITQLSNSVTNEELKGKILNKALPILKFSSKVVFRAFIAWASKKSPEAINEEFQEVISSESKDLIDKNVVKIFKEFENIDKNMALFKKTLLELTKSKKVVFVLDELDRCKPSFALSVLEKVKHVFDVDGIKFIFSTNIDQMKAVVMGQYGSTIDADKYLNKFFPFQFSLPQDYSLNQHNDYKNCSYEHFMNLYNEKKVLGDHLENPQSSINIMIERIFKINKLSLRDAEKFNLALEVYCIIKDDIKNMHLMRVGILLYALSLHCFNHDLKKKILNNEVTADDFFSSLKLQPIMDSGKTHGDIHFILFVSLLLGMEDEVSKYIKSDGELQRWRSEIKDIFKEERFYNDKKPLKFVTSTLRALSFQRVS